MQNLVLGSFFAHIQFSSRTINLAGYLLLSRDRLRRFKTMLHRRNITQPHYIRMQKAVIIRSKASPQAQSRHRQNRTAIRFYSAKKCVIIRLQLVQHKVSESNLDLQLQISNNYCSCLLSPNCLEILRGPTSAASKLYPPDNHLVIEHRTVKMNLHRQRKISALMLLYRGCA